MKLASIHISSRGVINVRAISRLSRLRYSRAQQLIVRHELCAAKSALYAMHDGHSGRPYPHVRPHSQPTQVGWPQVVVQTTPSSSPKALRQDPTVISVTQECPIRTDAASEATRDLYVSTVPSSTD